ncbi:hypothetical protein ABZX30_28810 [Streptomyces sp. NPDC004542]|uniref:hypothetical protein n=1 Tax=Streptomyces sp. NPDC004542 TaxID=3154281 RepID=UPI0033B3A091
MAISVGSVEVDVIPNTRNIYARMRAGLEPAASRVGDEIGRVIGRYVQAGLQGAVRDGIQNGGRQAQAPAARQGTATGSAFARSFKGRLEAALRDLPEVRLHANSSDADREIAQIRTQLQALRDVRIGIDVSEADAFAAMDRLRERLARLSASDANVQVRVDAGAASAQLAAFQAEINRLDGQSVDVDVDTHSAAANFNALTTAAIAFGPAIIPVLPVVAAGLGAIAAAGVAAAAGIGSLALVAVPAIKQIGTVLQAQKAAQDAAAQSTATGGQAAAQASSRALQLASAQQAVTAAERNGARQIAQAQAQVTQARQQAAQVAAQASLRSQQAARAVEDAERSLADAQKSAAQAQKDLTAARVQATQQLEDLNNRLTDAKLSQQDAEIALTEATAQRDAVLSNANATELDKRKALLAYDQAVQRVKEQTTETQRLDKETKAANKAGVDGSKTVKDAQAQVAQAQQAVADRTRALKDAQADQARTAQQNAQQIAQAQQRIADAQANVANAQQQAAEQAASAQRQLKQAQLSSVGGANAAATAQAKYQAELAKLTPAARQTMDAYLHLRDAFGAWSKSLQPAVMPLFTRALQGITGILPKLTPFVLQAAGAIQTLMDKASAQLKTPFWKGFYQDLTKSVKPAIIGFGVAFGNVMTGIAGIIDAFLPHMDGISGGMQTITQKFAAWGKSLKGSPAFEKFLSYASEMGPVVADTLGKIAGAVLSIGTALAPVSGPLLKVIGGLAQGIGWLAQNVPGLVPVIYGLIVATKLWALGQWAVNAAMEAFALISKAGPWGWIILGITAVVLAVLYMWKHFDWFRDAVKAVWDGIKAGGKAVVDWFSGPFSDFFTKTIPSVFRSLLDWVKRNWPWILGALTGPIGLAVVYVIKHWGAMRDGISSIWSSIKRWTIYPIRDFFTKTIPGWGTTLKNRIVGAFDEARKGIKTAWDKIKDIAKIPVAFVVNTVYNKGIRKVWNLVTDAFGGKHLDEIKGFATGGIMPGYTPGRDVHMVPSTRGPVALSGGEAIMRPEWTRAVGAGYVNAMNAAARQGGIGGVRSMLGFKGGGIFDGIGDVLGSTWDKVKKGTKWLADTFGGAVQAGVKHVVNPLIDAIPGGKIGFVGLLKSLMKDAVSKLVGAGKEGDKRSASSIGGVIPKGSRLAVISQALAAAHVPPPGVLAQWQAGLNTLITRESGWNPRAINRWDSNAKAGHPSQGLAQTIPGTFNAYVPRSLRSRGILDPVANVAAAIRYIVARYGNITNVQQANANRPPAGYDSGGWMPPGMNLMYNGLGQPEAVLTPQQWSAIQGAAARGADGASGPSHFEGNLYLDSGEFLGRVRGEAEQVMQAGQQRLISVINAT